LHHDPNREGLMHQFAVVFSKLLVCINNGPMLCKIDWSNYVLV